MSPTPILPADQAKFMDALRLALSLINPYKFDTTDTERRRMSPKAMGRDGIPFVKEASTLLNSHPDVLRRTITDAIIADYPVQLAIFEQSDEAAELLTTLADIVNTRRLASGVGLMTTARAAYQDGQNDKGATPGVSSIIDRMSQRFAHDTPSSDDGTPKS